MTTVRRYESADAEAVRRLNERALSEAGTDPEDVPDIDDIEDIEGEYLEAGGEFLVVERDGDLVGMGGLKVEGSDGELYRLRVAERCQREGVGSRLLAALEAAARKRDVDRLVAETARRQDGALSFYAANGYERVAERSFGEYDLVTYAKELST